MHFLLLGATGRTGQCVVSHLLSQGHTAVALARKPEAVKPQPGLTVVSGTPLSKDDIDKAIKASPLKVSAAIVTLSTVRESDSPFARQVSPPRFLADSCANVCQALEEAGIRRLVFMSTAGCGNSWENLPLLSRAFMGLTNIKYALRDHNLVDQEIRKTSLDWTLVRSVRLDFEPSKESLKEGKPDIETLGEEGQGMSLGDSATTSSVAGFLVKVAVDGLYSRQAVVVRERKA
ncbi:NAD(P)H-binding domain-containing protein [Sarocladium implicatum]|nr:NAD(P)H-binding domain-containing protein [Sarocladium implicatum]